MTLLARRGCAACVILLVAATWAGAAPQPPGDADDLLRQAVFRWMDLAQPAADAPRRTVTARFKLARADGLPAQAEGATLDFAYQWPDRLRAAVNVAGEEHSAGRDGQQLWVHRPGKKFGVVGKPGVPRFAADPTSIDKTTVPPFELPFGRLKARAVLLALDAEHAGREQVGGANCTVLRVALLKQAAELIGADTNVTLRVWLRDGDLMPMRLTATNGQWLNAQVDTLEATATAAPNPAGAWQIKPNDGDTVETVAVSHLTKMMEVGPRLMNQQIPPLGPATGDRRVVARSGKGRLELHDGTRVLFLTGTPEEMGRQHGELLRDQIRDVAEKILYGVGVGSSFYKGSWFFGEIEGAQSRVQKFVDPRVLREMDALADAAGVHRQESRLANFFPELFHCSGFALLPGATADGHVYHGRVLDYLRGVGLEQNAVVTVYQPTDGRHAWVNLSYAGFVGSVTAMNAKGISIGEMGGHGAGQWDGKPMAQLVREVMERAGTLDEAVAIMRAGPRTCEYYYVIADGNAKQAVGIGATPTTFEVVRPGESHPKLPHPVEGTVLLSADDRYELLAKRVKDGRGKFDAASARELMARPVCMTSNIQSVLFVPDTLDFYVANADGGNVASQTRYTKYNLRELLKPEGGGTSGSTGGGDRPKAVRPTGF